MSATYFCHCENRTYRVHDRPQQATGGRVGAGVLGEGGGCVTSPRRVHDGSLQQSEPRLCLNLITTFCSGIHLSEAILLHTRTHTHTHTHTHIFERASSLTHTHTHPTGISRSRRSSEERKSTDDVWTGGRTHLSETIRWRAWHRLCRGDSKTVVLFLSVLLPFRFGSLLS